MSRLHEMTKKETERYTLREVLSLLFVVLWMGAYILASNDWIPWATIGIAFVYIAWVFKRLCDYRLRSVLDAVSKAKPLSP